MNNKETKMIVNQIKAANLNFPLTIQMRHWGEVLENLLNRIEELENGK